MKTKKFLGLVLALAVCVGCAVVPLQAQENACQHSLILCSGNIEREYLNTPFGCYQEVVRDCAHHCADCGAYMGTTNHYLQTFGHNWEPIPGRDGYMCSECGYLN